jgi:protein-L-isoaspartate(D-aspartate) O-methyltransferase
MRALALLAILLPLAAGLAAAAPSAPEDSRSAAFRARRLALARGIEAEGVRDSATLEAMRSVPRHEFVLPRDRDLAYADHPLPIGHGQTISQPYIVAYMTEMLRARPGMKVLEVGTGSGYQAAVLASLGCRVFTVEIFAALASAARERLARLGYGGVMVRHADGHHGWAEEAPFDAVIVTAAAGHVPPALVRQLRPRGRMVIPVGTVYGIQNLILVEKQPDGRIGTRNLLPVRFVPMLEGLR